MDNNYTSKQNAKKKAAELGLPEDSRSMYEAALTRINSQADAILKENRETHENVIAGLNTADYLQKKHATSVVLEALDRKNSRELFAKTGKAMRAVGALDGVDIKPTPGRYTQRIIDEKIDSALSPKDGISRG